MKTTLWLLEHSVIENFYDWNSKRTKEPGYDRSLARLLESVQGLVSAREADAQVQPVQGGTLRSEPKESDLSVILGVLRAWDPKDITAFRTFLEARSIDSRPWAVHVISRGRGCV